MKRIHDLFEPRSDDLGSEHCAFDRRRFLQLTGLAGLGLGVGGGQAIAQTDLLTAGGAVAEPTPIVMPDNPALAIAPAACGNTPLGGPFLPDKGKANDLGPGTGEKVLFDLDRAWPIGQPIIVRFLNGQNDPWVQLVHQRVREIAPIWCDYANVTMQFVDNGPCHMTVNFLPFGQFTYGMFNCWLGTDCHKLKSQTPSMNLIFNPIMKQWPADFLESEFQRLILHEFGHALSMIHEHQRPDRPVVWMQTLYAYAKTTWGWDAKTVNEQIVRKENLEKLAGTSFDVHGIMMYPYPTGLAFYQKEGAPPNTPDLTRPFSTERNTRLTALDKAAAAVTYPKLGVGRIGEETLTAGAAARGGTIARGGQVAPFRFRTGAAGDYTIVVGGSMPALVSLTVTQHQQESRGKMGDIIAAKETVQGEPGTILKATGLAANRDYFVQVRDQKPTKGSGGDFTIALRQGPV